MNKEKIDDFEASVDILKDRMTAIKSELALGFFLYIIAGVGLIISFVLGLTVTAIPLTFSALYGGILFSTAILIFVMIIFMMNIKHQMRKFIILFKEHKHD